MDGASLRIQGDLLVSLWVWNATLTADGTTQELRTGPQQSSHMPPGTPDVSSLVSRDQEIYFYATNATLSVPALTAKAYTLLTGPGTEVSGGSFHLVGATGDLAVQDEGKILRASDVTLTGNANAVLSGQGAKQPFQARLAGSVEGGSVDGQALALATASPASGSPWMWPVGAVGLVAVSALAVPLRRRAKAARQHRLAHLAEEGMQWLARGDPERAGAVAAKILDLSPAYPQGHYIKASCLEWMQQLESALYHRRAVANVVRNGHRIDRELLGTNALQAAAATARGSQAGMDRRHEVVTWLQEALEADPRIVEDLSGYPELRPFLADVGVQWLDPSVS